MKETEKKSPEVNVISFSRRHSNMTQRKLKRFLKITREDSNDIKDSLIVKRGLFNTKFLTLAMCYLAVK